MKRMSGSTRSTPGSSGVGKGHAAVDDDPFAAIGRAVAVEREVHADLADAAERHEDQFGPVHIGHQINLSGAHAAPAEATAPKCTSPAAILITFAAARADHEAAILVDRLEHAAHDIAVDPHRDLRAQARRRAPASAGGCAPARGPRPRCGRWRSRRRTAPGTASRRRPRRRVPRARSPDRATSSGCATTLTPMPIASA